MASNSITYKALGDLLAEPLLNGLTRPKAVRGAGTKMVNMGEIFAHSRILSLPMDRVPLSDNEQRFLLKADDLLFARQSLVLSGAGKCSIFLGDEEPVTYESHIIRVRLDHALASPLFYYYFFTSPIGRQAIESIVEQVAAAGIRGSDLARLKVPYLPVEEQRAIARILGALDDKIELNRRQNATLEELARAIFKSWFVDFDPVRAKAEGRAPAAMDAATAALFPDGFEVIDGREVPRGWTFTYLRDVARFVKGLSYKSSDLQDSTTALVTLKSIGRGGGYRDEGLKPFIGEYKSDQVVQSGEIVVAHTDLTQAAEVLGRPALVRAHPHFQYLVASLDLMIVRPALEWVSREFLYDLLSREEFREHAYGYSNGTTVLHLSVKALPEYLFCLPSPQAIQAFTARAQPIYSKIEQNELQSRTLAALRDALLPRLLSGELRVREAERLVEERV